MLLPLITMAVATQIGAPRPLLPVPTPRQMAWQQMEYYAFVHFGPNTFTGAEWGNGKENPDEFDPKRLDCRQWVRAFKKAGMKGVIITAKHHDGFCLWPSKYSTHTVAQSRWRDGKGDVLRELSDACHAEGMKFGVYLSPWDRNHPTYGTPEYNTTFVSMLNEVLRNYGPVFEQWFDGANGEGPNGKKQVYDWPRFIDTVRQDQPGAVIFSDGGPDIRWVGNEAGYAGETDWSTLNRKDFYPGTPNAGKLPEGQEGGTDWVPAECDVSIRPGWFWRASEDAHVKTVQELMDIYYGSVGRNGSMLLNVPANSDGLISQVDIDRLMEFKRAREHDFAHPLRPRRVSAEPERGSAFAAAKATDDDPNSYWATPDGAKTGSLTLDFGRPETFDRVEIQEPIFLGQRVRSFEIQVRDGADWRTVAQGTTVGHKRLLRLDPQTAREVRLVVTDSRACPAISTFRLYDAGAAK